MAKVRGEADRVVSDQPGASSLAEERGLGADGARFSPPTLELSDALVDHSTGI